MKHAPNGREESKTARDWDPRTHETRASPTAGKYKEFTKQPRVTAETKQRGIVGADVPEVVPQSENVDETRRSEKDVDAEAQGLSRRRYKNGMVRISSQ